MNYSYIADQLQEKRRAEQARVPRLTSEQFFNQAAMTQDSLVTFYRQYFPEMTEQMCEALAMVYMRKKFGAECKPRNIKFADLKTSKPSKKGKGADTTDESTEEINTDDKWDWKRDVEEQRIEGLTRLTEQRLENLMNEEVTPGKRDSKPASNS